MRSVIHKMLPASWKKGMKKILSRDKASLDAYYCPVCENRISHFTKLDDYFLENYYRYGYIHSIFCYETFNVVNYHCSACYATDRERLYMMYLKEKISMNSTEKIRLLDFAPNEAVRKKIMSEPSVIYRSCDLLRPDVDDNTDIQDMVVYQDNEFDAIICSHVLEHVDDDGKAMAELFRILKPGGWAVIMVPILLTLNETFEDRSIISEEDRWKYFMQGDHVRTYSRNDFVKRLSFAGFKVKQLDKKYFGDDVFERNGIDPRSVLYVAEK
jgi:predicted SAM-dependent methyltransferase